MSHGITVAPISTVDEEHWDLFVDSAAGATVYHQIAWRHVMQKSFGIESWYLAAREGTRKILGVLPLVRLRSPWFGDFLVSVPYVNYGGPLSANPVVDELLMAAACELAAKLGVSHAEFRERRRRAGHWELRTDKVAMELPLQAEPESQWAEFPSKLRAQVRRPQKEGAYVVFGKLELIEDFYRVFSRTMRDLGTPVYSRQFFRQIATVLQEMVEIAVVYQQDQPVAAGLLIHYRGKTEIPWAGANRAFNPIGVNMLLYWSCIKRAIENGSTIFDFGRSSHGSGTFRFKRQWGAEPVQLFWNYWVSPGEAVPGLTPSNPKYALAVRAWQRLPLFLANALGPHLVKNLP